MLFFHLMLDFLLLFLGILFVIIGIQLFSMGFIAELIVSYLSKNENTDQEIIKSKDRPIRPGDIMILVRRRGKFVNQLVRALKELEIDVAGVDRMMLTDQLPIMDLVALGQFFLLPDDDLNLAIKDVKKHKVNKKDSIIGMINHHGKIVIAHGNSQLTEEDIALVFAKPDGRSKINKMFIS